MLGKYCVILQYEILVDRFFVRISLFILSTPKQSLKRSYKLKATRIAIGNVNIEGILARRLHMQER